MKKTWNWIRPALSDLEMPVLVFPVVATVIVAVTFLLPGGRCGAWQWWSAVAATICLNCVKTRAWIPAAKVNMAFLLFLAFVWLGSHLFVCADSFDAFVYHLPATRMMIEGWNPIWEGTFDGMLSSVGIDPANMSSYHILCMPKSI